MSKIPSHSESKLRCGNASREKEANIVFDEAKERFIHWMASKPTGKFGITIPVHQGGIRKHRFFVEEDGR